MRNITIRAFTPSESLHLIAEWPPLFTQWLAEGMVFPHTEVVGGIDAAPQALIDLVAGRHTGTVTVRLTEGAGA